MTNMVQAREHLEVVMCCRLTGMRSGVSNDDRTMDDAGGQSGRGTLVSADEPVTKMWQRVVQSSDR